MLDGYTSTDRYPYSQRLADGTSYMRNSVKVVIDAYDGTLDAYIVDAADPLARTYSKIFPGLMKPLSAMPADLRAHLRYPTDLFAIQSQLYATYHMDAPETFYHREDQWAIPLVTDQGEGERRFMRHIVMKLPEEKKAEFIYMAPFTPKGKDNLASWMIARNDGENYSKLRVYRFPKQSLGVRSASDHGAHRPGYGHIARADAVGSARLRGDPRRAAGDPDRGSSHLCAADLSAG